MAEVFAFSNLLGSLIFIENALFLISYDIKFLYFEEIKTIKPIGPFVFPY